MTTPATVDIVKVHGDAVKIKASELEVGDTVFDVFGGRHEVVQTRTLKEYMKFTRDDSVGYPTYWELDATVTVVKHKGETA